MTVDIDRLLKLHGELDKGDMLSRVRTLPEQIEEAWKIGREFAEGLDITADFSRVVVCGMGGSAIGGDMVASLLGDDARVPISVNRNYSVPKPLRGGTLFVYSSYSGNTGETLSSYDVTQGIATASVAISSGGELSARCERDGVPVCRIPGGMPPRSAIAYSLFPLLAILNAAGVATVGDDDVATAVASLSRLVESSIGPGDANRAAALANALHGKFPVVYHCGGLYDAVARRWSCQLNENAEVVAHFAAFPELNHNEIVGWRPQGVPPGDIVVVSLEDQEDHPRALDQAGIALGIIEPLASQVLRVRDVAGGRLERILSTMLLGDFASVYLAYLGGVDPTPVANIDLLKSRLKQ